MCHKWSYKAYFEPLWDQARKCVKTGLRRLIFRLFKPGPGNVPKVISEGLFWAFFRPGPEMCQNLPQKAHFEPFWAWAWNVTKVIAEGLFRAFLRPRPGNVPKLASEGTFWAFLYLDLEMCQSDLRNFILSLFESGPGMQGMKLELVLGIMSGMRWEIIYPPVSSKYINQNHHQSHHHQHHHHHHHQAHHHQKHHHQNPHHHHDHHHHLSIATAGTMGPLASRLLWHLCLTHMHMLGKSKASLINLHVQLKKNTLPVPMSS